MQRLETKVLSGPLNKQRARSIAHICEESVSNVFVFEENFVWNSKISCDL